MVNGKKDVNNGSSVPSKPVKTVKCLICGKAKNIDSSVPVDMIKESVLNTIKKKFPDLPAQGYVCIDDMNSFIADYVEDLLQSEKGELTALEKNVLKSMRRQETIAKNINKEFETKLTFGEHVADNVAKFGGSWSFIITFGSILMLWIIINTVVLMTRPFDPYPFILLNLVLSCLAAIQAPIIMMSQNRQSAKDRLRAEQDYTVNLKAELMVRHLNQKVDQLLSTQWGRLMEIQQIQVGLMEQIVSKKKK